MSAIANLPWRLIGAGAAMALVVALFLLWRGAEKEAETWEAKWSAQVAEYERASAQAEAQQRQALEVAQKRQQEITDEVSADYRKQLDDVRARADSLRRQLAAVESNRKPGALPRVPDTAGGVDAAAEEVGLSPAYCPLDDGLIATEQALQLNALQEWVREQKESADGRTDPL